MSLTRPRNGAVLRYAYLWSDQARQGKADAAKDRPAAVLLTFVDDDADQTWAAVVPLTTRPPSDPTRAVEIPIGVLESLGRAARPTWVICDEYNLFQWPGPDIRPIAKRDRTTWDYGVLPYNLYEAVRTKVLRLRAEGRLTTIGRTR